MKVYYTATPKSFDDRKSKLHNIYDIIEGLGYSHVTSFIKDVEPDEFYKQDNTHVKKNYKRFVSYIKACDVAVFEVTTQSMGIGQLLSYALSCGKPTVCLYEEGSKPFLLSGVEDTKLVLADYSENNLREVIEDAIEEATAQVDVRFNFFISPEIGNYLDWITKKRRLPRAVFLRGLLEDDMARNEEYKNELKKSGD